MKKCFYAALLLLSVVLISSPVFADSFSDTKVMFEKAGAGDKFDTAYGYDLFPTIGKAGFVIGGAYGKGHHQKKRCWPGASY